MEHLEQNCAAAAMQLDDATYAELSHMGGPIAAEPEE
jgi:hypothetical protein